MSDLDLIPVRYRQRQWVTGWLQRVGVVGAVLVLVLSVSKLSLIYAIEREKAQVAELQLAGDVALKQHSRVAELRAEAVDTELQLAILRQLRQGVVARKMLVVVDRALDPSVGFSSWTFRRAEEVVPGDADAVSTGYFLVVPKQAADDVDRAWRLKAHMEIRGRAVDHSSLAGFVRRLVDQPEIAEVRVLETRVLTADPAARVEFELAAVVRTWEG